VLLGSCRSGALAAIKGDSPLGISDQAIVITHRGEGAAPTRFEQVSMDKVSSYEENCLLDSGLPHYAFDFGEAGWVIDGGGYGIFLSGCYLA